jgi:hypothetical protein
LKLKVSLFAAGLLISGSLTINYQLSTINYQLSTINYQLSTINYQLFNIYPLNYGTCTLVQEAYGSYI